MPRIIEPVIGKVVGPLRMKVPSALAKSNDSKDHTCSHRSDTVPNQNDRRGRYSRNRGNMRKLRSKSLPQSSNSSILLGKPPESDDPFHVDLPTPKAGSMEKRAFKASKTSSKQNDMGSFGVFDCDDTNEDASNATDLNPISSLPAKRRALALDTRYHVSKVDVIEKAQCWESTFIRHCKDFLRTLDCREAAPSILAVSKTIGSGSSTRGNPAMAALGIETEAFNLVKGLDRTIIDKAIDVSDRSIISGIPVRTTKSSGVAMPIPVACQAKSSWLLFSSLVDSIMVEDSLCSGFVSSNKLHKNRPPLSITILCTDASLFCDTNFNSHKDYLQDFLKHVATFLDQGLLCSIHIVAAATGDILLRSDRGGLEGIEGNCNSHRLTQLDPVILQSNHEKAVQKCVRLVESTMNDWEGRCNTPWNIDAPERRGLHLNLSFSSIDNTPTGFMGIARSQLCDELISHRARVTCRLRSIELPPSTDGTHCALSLEASYQIFPFSAGSPHARMLSCDMDSLSKMDFQVLKLVPLTCIDASLLFGIPMVVRSGLESDYAQFHEMKVLVRSLFHFLQLREQAILLRGSCCVDVRANALAVDRSSRSGLFQSDAPNSCSQYFVLMSQEVPYSMLVGGKKSDAGLLFRIAHADYLIAETSNLSMTQNDSDELASENDQEMETQHMELIESSLASLEISVFNPIFDSLSGIGPTSHFKGFVEDVDRNDAKLQNGGSSDGQSMSPPFNPFITPQVENLVTPAGQPMDVSIYDLPSNNCSDDGNDDMTNS